MELGLKKTINTDTTTTNTWGKTPFEFMGFELSMELAPRRGAGGMSGAAGTLYPG